MLTNPLYHYIYLTRKFFMLSLQLFIFLLRCVLILLNVIVVYSRTCLCVNFNHEAYFTAFEELRCHRFTIILEFGHSVCHMRCLLPS